MIAPMPPTLALLRAYVFLRMIEIDFWSNYELSYYSWELLSFFFFELWVELLFFTLIHYSWVIMSWVIILENYWVFLSIYELNYFCCELLSILEFLFLRTIEYLWVMTWVIFLENDWVFLVIKSWVTIL